MSGGAEHRKATLGLLWSVGAARMHQYIKKDEVACLSVDTVCSMINSNAWNKGGLKVRECEAEGRGDIRLKIYFVFNSMSSIQFKIQIFPCYYDYFYYYYQPFVARCFCCFMRLVYCALVQTVLFCCMQLHPPFCSFVEGAHKTIIAFFT